MGRVILPQRGDSSFDDPAWPSEEERRNNPERPSPGWTGIADNDDSGTHTFSNISLFNIGIRCFYPMDLTETRSCPTEIFPLEAEP
jgi:hypothetical protein